MPNRDNPMGLRALRNRNGSHPPVRLYDASTSQIFEGQMVLLSSSGLVTGVPAAGVGSLAKNVIGVAAAHKPATTAAQIAAGLIQHKVQVYVDPDQLFVAQSDDASLDSRTDYIGRNFKLILPAGGSSTTLQSTCEIDGSTGTSVSFLTASACPVQIVDKWNQVNNVVTTGGTASSNADFIVRILPRYHLFAGSTGK